MDQVEEIKSKIDIVSLIGEYVTLARAGRNFKANCPFHQERTPSFMVSPELSIWKCFGCGLGGDAISFIQKQEGLEFYEALKMLADRVGVKLERVEDSNVSYKEKLVETNRLASEFYKFILLNHNFGKNALDYLLTTRGLKLATIKEFGLGFAPDVPQALYGFLTKKKSLKPFDLEKAGLVVAVRGSYIDRFRGRVIFPLTDARGAVVGLAGRILPGKDSERLAKYINSPETEVYHKSKLLYGFHLTRKKIKEQGLVVIVEGELDAISSWQVGVKNVVAIKGSAFTEDQVRLLTRITSKAVLALDSDIAGNLAARRGIETAQNLGLNIKVARLGKYKDPDEAARSDADFYKNAINEAISIWDFLIDSVFSKYRKIGGREKSLISKEIVPILGSIADEIVRAHYIKVVAQKLDVSMEVVIKEVEKKERAKGVKSELIEDTHIGIPAKSREELLEREVFSLGTRIDPNSLLVSSVSNLFQTPLWTKILFYLKKYLNTNKKFTLSGFAKSLPKELLDGFSLAVFTEEESAGEDKLLREFNGTKKELKLLRIKRQEVELIKQIALYEKKGEKIKLRKVKEKFNNLARKRASLEEE